MSNLHAPEFWGNKRKVVFTIGAMGFALTLALVTGLIRNQKTTKFQGALQAISVPRGIKDWF